MKRVSKSGQSMHALIKQTS